MDVLFIESAAERQDALSSELLNAKGCSQESLLFERLVRASLEFSMNTFSWRRTRNLSEFMNWKLRILDIEHLFAREKFGENQLMRASCRGAVAQLQSTWPAFWPSGIRLVNGNLFISRKALATAGCHPTDADRQETVLLWTVLASCSRFHWLFKRDECLFNWKKKLKSQKHCEQCASLEMAGDPKSLNFENM